MNERVTRVVEEILKFDTDELEAVLGLGERELRSRIFPNRIRAPYFEYERHRSYLEAGSVGYEPRAGDQGFFVLPRGSILTLSPTAHLPNGNSFAVVNGRSVPQKYVAPLSGPLMSGRKDVQ